jgi:hypothetical protein
MDDYQNPENSAPENSEPVRIDDLSQNDEMQQAHEQPMLYSVPQSTFQTQSASPPPYNNNAQMQYYQPQYNNPPRNYNYYRPPNGKATASLVLGIISLVFWWMSVFAVISVICSIIGIVLGASARNSLRPEQGGGQATAGLVCSIIALVLSLLMLVIIVGLLVMIPHLSNVTSV